MSWSSFSSLRIFANKATGGLFLCMSRKLSKIVPRAEVIPNIFVAFVRFSQYSLEASKCGVFTCKSYFAWLQCTHYAAVYAWSESFPREGCFSLPAMVLYFVDVVHCPKYEKPPLVSHWYSLMYSLCQYKKREHLICVLVAMLVNVLVVASLTAVCYAVLGLLKLQVIDPFISRTRKIAGLNTHLVFPFVLVYHVHVSMILLYSWSHKFLKHEITEKVHIFKQLCHTVWNLEQCGGYIAKHPLQLSIGGQTHLLQRSGDLSWILCS